MKKSIVIIIVIIVIVAIVVGVYFAINGNNENTNAINDSNSDEFAENTVSYTIEYNGANITPGQVFSKEALGDEQQYSEIPSCAFAGLDKVYNYGSFEITTSDIDNEEKIYSVYLLDDTISTKEGVKIADEKSSMLNAYGENYQENGNEYSYTDGSVKLSFIVENDVITSIQYTMVTE